MTLDNRPLSVREQKTLRALDRAAGDLRRGEGVFVIDTVDGVARDQNDGEPAGNARGLLIFSLDHADAGTLALIRREDQHPGQLLLTGARAQALGLMSGSEEANSRSSDEKPGIMASGVGVFLPDSATLEWAQFVAMASWDAKQRSSLLHQPLRSAGTAALRLAKLAPCLPALLAQDMTLEEADALVPGVLPIRAADAKLFHRLQARSLRRLGTTPVPLDGLGTVQFHMFRSSDGHEDHLALEVGERPAPRAGGALAPLVRLHSACLTGDIFHSAKCDCGPQLNGALAAMREAGHGVLLYLAQEGRNIGLSNKLRAYLLQDVGLDTVDANRALGYADDERDYEIAARMLEGLGFSGVRLMTNNPHKIAALTEAGVHVVEQVPLIAGVRPENRRYLQTKAKKSGHILPDAALDALEGPLKKG